ncbi:MAG: sigma-70 family RNA polymerase sigma factor [Candidatus Eisenbacteria bacterium]|uniref:Sigma-70 family RNA polymerase sigma factor n=1 Tax=Eiseniibacteriota bacterium TaxID=2212470 RepID=A0A956NDP7_UNCEI|nr:sigma-70 family RNA polymerase sigma factor [Candidatus Eisenbacteria bacterium]
MEDTGVLLARVRSGDIVARNELFARYLPVLTRWAHSRLPRTSRDLRDTGDLVQETLLRALGRVHEFQYRGEGAFLGYLRQILVNALRDDARRARSAPDPTTLDEGLHVVSLSPLEEAVGRRRLDAFDEALDRLAPEPRLGVVLRVEFGLSYQEIAEATGRPTADAARTMVSRALVTVAKSMGGSV